jgi:hypothetical protein
MKAFYLKFFKPMLWFWIALIIAVITLATMNFNGYRLFSNNNNSWNSKGPGYHK